MKRNIYLLPFLLIGTIFVGCTSFQLSVPNELEISFRKMILIEDMNDSIGIRKISSENAKYGSDVKVSIENLSSQPIYFPLDFVIRLFIIRDNKWVEIQDKNQYYGEGTMLHPQDQQESIGRVITWVRPVLPMGISSADNQDILRILITGEVQGIGVDNETLVGAYADIIIHP